VELKIQEYGAYQATTGQGKFDGMAMGPFAVAWEGDSALYGPYMPDQPRNRGHINDPKLTAMVQEQRRTKDPEARKQIVYQMQQLIYDNWLYTQLVNEQYIDAHAKTWTGIDADLNAYAKTYYTAVHQTG